MAVDRGRAGSGRWGVRDRLLYRFESHIAGGPLRVLTWLGCVTAVVAMVAGLVLWFIHGHRTDPDASVPEALWESATRLLDPGTFAGDAGWQRRGITLFVTICGLLITSVLIGLTAAGFDSKMVDLRKGHGRVLESGHTLILGWSPRIFVLLNELVAANENQRLATIVILADEDAEWMNDQVRHRFVHLRQVRILCRAGQPSSSADLRRVQAPEARSIVILGPDGHGDALAIKSMLGLISIDLDFNQVPVIVELNDARNARDLAIHNHIVPVRADEIVALVTAQSCRQPGLAEVLTDLLDFAGDEIYFHRFPELGGVSFAEAQLRIATSCLIGMHTSEGGIVLAPPADYLIGAGDELIVIASDDDTTRLGDFTPSLPVPASDAKGRPTRRSPENLLILNWNHLGCRVLEELDGYVPPGSKVVVVVDDVVTTAPVVVSPNLRNLSVEVEGVDDDLARALYLLQHERFDHVLVLGYRDHLSHDESDARTLLAVLTIDRKIVGPHRPRLVAEVLDERSADLMRTAGADDFVISTALSGLLLAQLAERVELMGVFQELFDVGGARVEMVPIAEYVDLSAGAVSATFAEFVATVAAESDVLIGYRKPPQTVKLNPAKSEVVHLGRGDQLIVVRRTAPTADITGGVEEISLNGAKPGISFSPESP